MVIYKIINICRRSELKVGVKYVQDQQNESEVNEKFKKQNKIYTSNAVIQQSNKDFKL